MSEDRRRVRIRVRGRVQGVGYRWATGARARDLGVVGWARNREDGSVEIVAEGAASPVQSLIDWCHSGPSAARVSDVEVVDDRGTESFDDFETRW